jgi:hypothetical protein
MDLDNILAVIIGICMCFLILSGAFWFLIMGYEEYIDVQIKKENNSCLHIVT